MNEIFIWNKRHVYYYSLIQRRLNSINFSIPIDESTATNYIKRVSAPPNVSFDSDIAITVSVNSGADTVIIWDYGKNIEDDSYDVKPNAEIMFD